MFGVPGAREDVGRDVRESAGRACGATEHRVLRLALAPRTKVSLCGGARLRLAPPPLTATAAATTTTTALGPGTPDGRLTAGPRFVRRIRFFSFLHGQPIRGNTVHICGEQLLRVIASARGKLEAKKEGGAGRTLNPTSLFQKAPYSRSRRGALSIRHYQCDCIPYKQWTLQVTASLLRRVNLRTRTHSGHAAMQNALRLRRGTVFREDCFHLSEILTRVKLNCSYAISRAVLPSTSSGNSAKPRQRRGPSFRIRSPE